MANVWFEYARQPLTVFDTGTNMRSSIVPDMLTIHLTGGIGLTRWLSLGVDLPIIVYQTGDYQSASRATSSRTSARQASVTYASSARSASWTTAMAVSANVRAPSNVSDR